MERAKILRKIKLLSAMTVERGATPAEAQVAREKIELLHKLLDTKKTEFKHFNFWYKYDEETFPFKESIFEDDALIDEILRANGVI